MGGMGPHDPAGSRMEVANSSLIGSGRPSPTRSSTAAAAASAAAQLESELLAANALVEEALRTAVDVSSSLDARKRVAQPLPPARPPRAARVRGSLAGTQRGERHYAQVDLPSPASVPSVPFPSPTSPAAAPASASCACVSGPWACGCRPLHGGGACFCGGCPPSARPPHCLRHLAEEVMAARRQVSRSATFVVEDGQRPPLVDCPRQTGVGEEEEVTAGAAGDSTTLRRNSQSAPQSRPWGPGACRAAQVVVEAEETAASATPADEATMVKAVATECEKFVIQALPQLTIRRSLAIQRIPPVGLPKPGARPYGGDGAGKPGGNVVLIDASHDQAAAAREAEWRRNPDGDARAPSGRRGKQRRQHQQQLTNARRHGGRRGGRHSDGGNYGADGSSSGTESSLRHRGAPSASATPRHLTRHHHQRHQRHHQTGQRSGAKQVLEVCSLPPCHCCTGDREDCPLARTTQQCCSTDCSEGEGSPKSGTESKNVASKREDVSHPAPHSTGPSNAAPSVPSRTLLQVGRLLNAVAQASSSAPAAPSPAPPQPPSRTEQLLARVLRLDDPEACCACGLPLARGSVRRGAGSEEGRAPCGVCRDCVQVAGRASRRRRGRASSAEDSASNSARHPSQRATRRAMSQSPSPCRLRDGPTGKGVAQRKPSPGKSPKPPARSPAGSPQRPQRQGTPTRKSPGPKRLPGRLRPVSPRKPTERSPKPTTRSQQGSSPPSPLRPKAEGTPRRRAAAPMGLRALWDALALPPPAQPPPTVQPPRTQWLFPPSATAMEAAAAVAAASDVILPAVIASLTEDAPRQPPASPPPPPASSSPPARLPRSPPRPHRLSHTETHSPAILAEGNAATPRERKTATLAEGNTATRQRANRNTRRAATLQRDMAEKIATMSASDKLKAKNPNGWSREALDRKRGDVPVTFDPSVGALALPGPSNVVTDGVQKSEDAAPVKETSECETWTKGTESVIASMQRRIMQRLQVDLMKAVAERSGPGPAPPPATTGHSPPPPSSPRIPSGAPPVPPLPAAAPLDSPIRLPKEDATLRSPASDATGASVPSAELGPATDHPLEMNSPAAVDEPEESAYDEDFEEEMSPSGGASPPPSRSSSAPTSAMASPAPSPSPSPSPYATPISSPSPPPPPARRSSPAERPPWLTTPSPTGRSPSPRKTARPVRTPPPSPSPPPPSGEDVEKDCVKTPPKTPPPTSGVSFDVAVATPNSSPAKSVKEREAAEESGWEKKDMGETHQPSTPSDSIKSESPQGVQLRTPSPSPPTSPRKKTATNEKRCVRVNTPSPSPPPSPPVSDVIASRSAPEQASESWWWTTSAPGAVNAPLRPLPPTPPASPPPSPPRPAREPVPLPEFVIDVESLPPAPARTPPPPTGGHPVPPPPPPPPSPVASPPISPPRTPLETSHLKQLRAAFTKQQMDPLLGPSRSLFAAPAPRRISPPQPPPPPHADASRSTGAWRPCTRARSRSRSRSPRGAGPSTEAGPYPGSASQFYGRRQQEATGEAGRRHHHSHHNHYDHHHHRRSRRTLGSSSTSPPASPLAAAGCVSGGGRADKSRSLMKVSDGAARWLTPSAARLVRRMQAAGTAARIRAIAAVATGKHSTTEMQERTQVAGSLATEASDRRSRHALHSRHPLPQERPAADGRKERGHGVAGGARGRDQHHARRLHARSDTTVSGVVSTSSSLELSLSEGEVPPWVSARLFASIGPVVGAATPANTFPPRTRAAARRPPPASQATLSPGEVRSVAPSDSRGGRLAGGADSPAIVILPGGVATVLDGLGTVPNGVATVPAGDKTLPGGVATVPAGDKTRPGGVATVSGGDAMLPGGVTIVYDGVIPLDNADELNSRTAVDRFVKLPGVAEKDRDDADAGAGGVAACAGPVLECGVVNLEDGEAADVGDHDQDSEGRLSPGEVPLRQVMYVPVAYPTFAHHPHPSRETSPIPATASSSSSSTFASSVTSSSAATGVPATARDIKTPVAASSESLRPASSSQLGTSSTRTDDIIVNTGTSDYSTGDEASSKLI